MGLIYVNLEAPNGKPDPLAPGNDFRGVSGQMAMEDEETVALIAAGHCFGKAHDAANPHKCLEKAPSGAGFEEQGIGWQNKCKTGKGVDTITSVVEGAWTTTPT